MAKSIRSKSKRRNRSVLRKTLCDPVIAARQNKVSKALSDNLKERKGSSIVELKSIFHKKSKEDSNDNNLDDNDNMEEEIDEGAGEDDTLSETIVEKKRVQDKFKDKKNNDKPKKTKKLVWF